MKPTGARVVLVVGAVLLMGALACQPGSTTTSTTLAPGVMTFDTLTDRFETLLHREAPAQLLQYSVMTVDEVAWLSYAAVPVKVTDVRGYRFANGDITVLFFFGPGSENSGDAGQGQQIVNEMAQERYGRGGARVWTLIDSGFGFVVASSEYWSELGRWAQWAREAYPELIYGE